MVSEGHFHQRDFRGSRSRLGKVLPDRPHGRSAHESWPALSSRNRYDSDQRNRELHPPRNTRTRPDSDSPKRNSSSVPQSSSTLLSTKLAKHLSTKRTD